MKKYDIATMSYKQYLENWVPPLHPKSEADLEPLEHKEFLSKRQHLIENEEELMETHFGHLEPLELSKTIELLAQIM